MTVFFNFIIMSEVLSYKYLISSDQDVAWGMTVNSVGTQRIIPDYVSYPPKTGHPDEYLFDPVKGRVLDCYQILYITDGSGYYYMDPGKRVERRSGNMLILRPNVWHSYFPKKETGWKEYWIGLQGINIDIEYPRTGDLTQELAPTRIAWREYPISEFFDEAFFETKKVVYAAR